MEFADPALSGTTENIHHCWATLDPRVLAVSHEEFTGRNSTFSVNMKRFSGAETTHNCQEKAVGSRPPLCTVIALVYEACCSVLGSRRRWNIHMCTPLDTRQTQEPAAHGERGCLPTFRWNRLVVLMNYQRRPIDHFATMIFKNIFVT